MLLISLNRTCDIAMAPGLIASARGRFTQFLADRDYDSSANNMPAKVQDPKSSCPPPTAARYSYLAACNLARPQSSETRLRTLKDRNGRPRTSSPATTRQAPASPPSSPADDGSRYIDAGETGVRARALAPPRAPSPALPELRPCPHRYRRQMVRSRARPMGRNARLSWTCICSAILPCDASEAAMRRLRNGPQQRSALFPKVMKPSGSLT